MKLLMISTDKKMFEQGSEVSLRQIEYATKYEELHVIVFTPREQKEIFVAPNMWVYPTQSRSRWFYPLDAIKLGRFIINGRGITHITTEDSSLTAMVGVSLMKRFNIPLELNIHTDIGSPYFAVPLENKIRKAMALSYIPQADTIRVVSERIKTYVVQDLKIDETKITVRPIVVDREKIMQTPITIDLHTKYPQFKKIVLMASRLEKEKNIHLAIRAWREVRTKIPGAGLIIVGKGKELKRLKEEARQVQADGGAQKSIVFEEWVSQDILVSYYKTADLFVNLSFYEGYGLTLIEAEAAGTKIVSTDVGVAREVGATIVGYEPRDVARAIIERLS